MLTSLVELEECVGSVVGNAWLYLCAGGVVTVLGVDESLVELEECSFGYGVVGNA